MVIPLSSEVYHLVKITTFKTQAEFRRWLEKNQARDIEVWPRFYRKDTGKAGLTYLQALDEALCFGWIDGVKKKLDDESYTNRFTPRKPRSTWSLVNLNRADELIRLGLMAPRGRAALEARDREKSGYSLKARVCAFSEEQLAQFKANSKAWEFFEAQPPGYRRSMCWWVTSAKREETQAKRLSVLIKDSAGQRRVGMLAKPTSQRPRLTT